MLRALLVVLALWFAGCQEAGTPAAGRLNLNRATIAELEALPAVGPKLARSIMASRNARGGRFDNLDQLLEIDGIGAKTLAAIRPHVVVE